MSTTPLESFERVAQGGLARALGLSQEQALAAWQACRAVAHADGAPGRCVLRNLRFDASSREWKGRLVTPDAGDVEVTAALDGASTLKVVAHKFLFSKTPVWTRKA